MNARNSGVGDALEFFGADPDEIEIGPERNRQQNKEVCVCGHPMAHHERIDDTRVICLESKMLCPCQHMRAVLEVGDLRAFKFDTEGSGKDHALWKGLKKLRQMGKTAKTLVGSECWKCLKTRPIEPVPITPENRVSRYPQARNVMICIRCRYVLDGIDPSFLTDDEEETVPGEAVGPIEAPGIANPPEGLEGQKAAEWPNVFGRSQMQDEAVVIEVELETKTQNKIPFVKLDKPPF